VSAMSHRLIDNSSGEPRFGNKFNTEKAKKIGTLRNISQWILFCRHGGVCSSCPWRLTPDGNCSFVRLFSAIAVRIDDGSSMFIVRDP
jgi:hypothetical protein